MSRPKELGQPGFTIYWEDLESYTESLSEEEMGRALCALWWYYSDGEEEDWPGMFSGTRLMYNQLLQKIEAQCDKYEETCARNREIAKKRGSKAAS